MVACAMFVAQPVAAKVLSSSNPKVTQLKIVHGAKRHGQPKGGYQVPGASKKGLAWGISSDFIGPGDIRRLMSVDIYLDSYSRISAIKVKVESYTGDILTSIYTNIVEFSIQTLKPGVNRPHKQTPITIRTADSLKFP